MKSTTELNISKISKKSLFREKTKKKMDTTKDIFEFRIWSNEIIKFTFLNHFTFKVSVSSSQSGAIVDFRLHNKFDFKNVSSKTKQV